MGWLNPLFASTELRSGPSRVSLLELFTSQGCNSCPPTDRWISELLSRRGLWVSYVPVAFHVDYWDYIGWKDHFAEPAFGIRQRRYENEGGVHTVYTPGMLLNGREWRQWRNLSEPTEAGSSAGLLIADIDAGVTDIRFSPSDDIDDNLLANVALLGFGLESEINAGENRGRTLVNDFVVLGLDQIGMRRKDGDFIATARVPSTDVRARRYAVVVWISPSDRQAPLQAAGAWYNR
jgi:hypothetical protein